MSPLFKNDLIWSFFFRMNSLNGKVVVCDLLKKLTENWLLHVNVNIIIMHIGSELLFIECKKHCTNSCLYKWKVSVTNYYFFMNYNNRNSLDVDLLFCRDFFVHMRVVYFAQVTLSFFFCVFQLTDGGFNLENWHKFWHLLRYASSSDVALLLLLRKNCDP